jgi:iron(III) transport system ATP-binding protein
MSFLRLDNLSKKYPGAEYPALGEVSFGVEEHEVLALVGESGSGKTTTVRIIAGFEYPDEGKVILDGTELAGPDAFLPPERRRIGVVFQENTLFPHLSVEANIRFGLPRKERSNPRESAAHLQRLLDMTGLAGFERRYPHEISGGQMQRVALARALAPSPKLLLLDEPFNNLDITLKNRVISEVRSILATARIPALLVTHSRREAFSLADRIAVIREGRIEQVGSPAALYRTPGSRYVAEFFGPVNAVPAEREQGQWRTPFGPIAEGHIVEDGAGATALLRPEMLSVSQENPGRGVRCRVTNILFFGDHFEVELSTDTLTEPVTVLLKGGAAVREGEELYVFAPLPW